MYLIVFLYLDIDGNLLIEYFIKIIFLFMDINIYFNILKLRKIY